MRKHLLFCGELVAIVGYVNLLLNRKNIIGIQIVNVIYENIILIFMNICTVLVTIYYLVTFYKKKNNLLKQLPMMHGCGKHYVWGIKKNIFRYNSIPKMRNNNYILYELYIY